MDILWAPWRMEYIQGVDHNHDECIFCLKPVQDKDRDNLIIFRAQHNFVILNKYPYNNGHCMIVPYQHTASIESLCEETSSEMWRLLLKCKKALFEAFHPEGFNIGMNLGRIAGAGIDSHIHLHIVPRWNGDTNFMPIIAETKIISQEIFKTYDILAPYFTL